MYHIGIDLHGTLIPDNEIFDSTLTGAVVNAMQRLRGKAKIYVCTGNDLPFVQRKLPKELVEAFDGFILETGCVYSKGENEEVLVGDTFTIQIRELESKLKKENFSEVYKFARRLATIALFVKNGESVHDLWETISQLIFKWGYDTDFDVVYSSVAVDIRPKGFNKYTGLQRMAGKDKTIAIADSYNDCEMLVQSDCAFIPNDLKKSKELVVALELTQKRVITLDNQPLENCVYITKEYETKGVIEALNYLSTKL